MSDLSRHLITAIALVFVIEGLLYALFPGMLRKMMAMALLTDPDKLRLFGLGMAIVGAVLAWLSVKALG